MAENGKEREEMTLCMMVVWYAKVSVLSNGFVTVGVHDFFFVSSVFRLSLLLEKNACCAIRVVWFPIKWRDGTGGCL